MGASDNQRSDADIIRDVYVEWRRRTHRTYVPGAKYDQHWKKAAVLVQAIAADPRIFVEAQFTTGVWGDSNIPWPNQLHSDAAEKNYQRYVDQRGIGTNAAGVVGQQFKYLSDFIERCGLTVDEAVDQADAVNPFRHFFRLLVCSESLFPKLYRRGGHIGKAEISSDSALHAYLLVNYEYRTQRILCPEFSGHDVGAHFAPPPASPAGRTREI